MNSPATRAAARGALVPHSRPCLGRDEEEAALRVLRSGRLAPGPEAARCEALLARLAGGADAVALASGTLALTLALRALGLGPRDRVALPAYACAALLHAVRAAGAVPVLCDIEPSGLGLDPEDLARRSASPPQAVVLVHPFGLPVRPDPFRARGLRVVEDCAQALGAADRGAPVGSRGDAAVFSFAPTKVVTCGGPGGALAAPRGAVVLAARDLAGHDEKADDRPRRVNGLMGDLPAASAAVQIGRISEFRGRRAAIAARYDAAFADLPLGRPSAPPDSRPIAYRYLVRAPRAARLIEDLNRSGIMARRPVFRPLHRLLGLEEPFPETDRAHAELVSLPIYPAMTDGEVDRVVAEVRRCLP
jgi:dTDP-4-amino-4,6-dideoxygalactose transaminase